MRYSTNFLPSVPSVHNVCPICLLCVSAPPRSRLRAVFVPPSPSICPVVGGGAGSPAPMRRIRRPDTYIYPPPPSAPSLSRPVTWSRRAALSQSRDRGSRYRARSPMSAYVGVGRADGRASDGGRTLSLRPAGAAHRICTRAKPKAVRAGHCRSRRRRVAGDSGTTHYRRLVTGRRSGRRGAMERVGVKLLVGGGKGENEG